MTSYRTLRLIENSDSYRILMISYRLYDSIKVSYDITQDSMTSHRTLMISYWILSTQTGLYDLIQGSMTSYRPYRTFRTSKNLQYIFHLFKTFSFFLSLVKVLIISLKKKNLILLIFSFFVLVSIPTIFYHFLPLANLGLSSLSNSLRSYIRLSSFLHFSVGIYCSAIFLVLLLLHLISFYYAIFSISVSRSFQIPFSIPSLTPKFKMS